MNIFQRTQVVLANLIGKVTWKARDLSPEKQKEIYDMLAADHYLIMTRRTNHLSTFFIGLGGWIKTGTWSYWSHILMNLEDDVSKPADFRLIEAIGTGTEYTPFAQVFDVQHVALLTPKGLTVEEWTEVMSGARQQIGKKYDSLFDLKTTDKISCVELVRLALMTIPDYSTKFADFEANIAHVNFLTPQMFYDCDDFEIRYEAHL